MTIYKIKWKSYIADLYLPKRGENRNKIVILVPGLPKSSNVDKLVRVFLAAGCAVLYPNFSGTFDSGGFFDGWQSIKDVREFLNWVNQATATELYFDKKIRLGSQKRIILVGMSFGAIISLFACNKQVDKLLLLSPVFLFNQGDINKITNFDFGTQMDSLLRLLKRAFPYTYRIKSFRSLQRFIHGQAEQLSRQNIEYLLKNLVIPTLIIHGKLDQSIPWQVSNDLRKSVNNKKIKWEFLKIGHSNSTYNRIALKKISEFVR